MGHSWCCVRSPVLMAQFHSICHTLYSCTAGSNVMTLFKSRGWSAIVADVLVDTVLLMVSLAIGILTGLSLALLASVANWSQEMMGVALMYVTLNLRMGRLVSTTPVDTVFSSILSVL